MMLRVSHEQVPNPRVQNLQISVLEAKKKRFGRFGRPPNPPAAPFPDSKPRTASKTLIFGFWKGVGGGGKSAFSASKTLIWRVWKSPTRQIRPSNQCFGGRKPTWPFWKGGKPPAPQSPTRNTKVPGSNPPLQNLQISVLEAAVLEGMFQGSGPHDNRASQTLSGLPSLPGTGQAQEPSSSKPTKNYAIFLRSW